jgi:DNA polymerase/3'-5' exonuclease PolX
MTSAGDHYVLAPLRRGRNLSKCRDCKVGMAESEASICQACFACFTVPRHSPFLNLTINENNVCELGKHDFLETMWSACGCCKKELVSASKGSSLSSICADCTAVTDWVRPSIPRSMVRLQAEHAGDATAGATSLQIWIRAAKYATLNYVYLVSPSRGERIALNNHANVINQKSWMGPWHWQQGDVLRFLALPKNITEAKGTTTLFTLEFQFCRVVGSANEGHTMSWKSSPRDLMVDANVVSMNAASNVGFPFACQRYGSALEALEASNAALISSTEAKADDREDASNTLPSLDENWFESQLPATMSKHELNTDATTSQQRRKAVPSNRAEVSWIDDRSLTIHTERSASILPRALSPAMLGTDEGENGETQTCTSPDESDVTTRVSNKAAHDACLVGVHRKRNGGGDSELGETDAAHEMSSTPEPVCTADARHEPTTLEKDETKLSISAQQPLLPDQGSLPNVSEPTHDEPCLEQLSSPLQMRADKRFLLYFVPKGSDMHKKTHIEGLRRLAEERGAVVMDSFDKQTRAAWPSHFVMSQKVASIDSFAPTLGFRNLDELVTFVQEHGIVCATRDWAASNSYDKVPFKEPTMLEQILGFRRHKLSKQAKRPRKGDGAVSSAKGQNLDHPGTSTTRAVRNVALSELFHKLSKLHQQCPLYLNDDWKAYMFQLISGRLRQLDFEVKNDPDVLNRLKQIQGFGDSSMQIITEFLETGRSSRIQEFETNKERVAMSVMMNIWGVGRVRAAELVNAGYTCIGSVRQAVANGTLRLDRNQYIGLLCYEDILEEMPREEVEAITQIVADATKARFPSAELVTMGSYRRGKTTCGDVDILITHPHYVDSVGSKILGAIVDDLRAAGHIAYHLTFISGMKHDQFETLPADVANKLTRPESYGRSVDKDDRATSSSWMGIFFSPVIRGKRRRVDIKFYPYAERVYAALYFTGNGHFNRSMRLWATRKFKYQLSDHGLIDKDSRKPVLRNPDSERTVFDALGMKWKEPHERDCFDAVESSRGEKASDLPQPSRAEILAESQTHAWIN